MKALGLLPALAGLLVAAAPAPEDFALRANFEAQPGLVVVALDEAIYRAARTADLHDLHFFNADGEALPSAALPAPPLTTPGVANELRLVALPALPAVRDQVLADFALRIEKEGARAMVELTPLAPARDRAEAIGGYLLDLRAHVHTAGELQLRFADDAPDFSGRVEILGSDDLHSWRPLAAGPLVLNRQLGAAFERSSFAIRGAAPFLRITWNDDAPRLVGARLVERASPPPLPRAKLAVVPGEAPGSWFVEIPPALPVARVHVRVPRENDVVRVRVYRYDGREPRARARLPLTRPRHAPEQWVAEGGVREVFRLQRGGAWVEGEPFTLSARTSRLRIDQVDRAPAVGVPLEVEAEWTPQRLVVAARGPGPYTLAVGNDASDLPAGPTLDAGSVLPRDDAAGTSLPVARVAAAATATVDATRAFRFAREASWSRYVLWGVLLAAVLALALMAWRLAAQMRKPTVVNRTGKSD